MADQNVDVAQLFLKLTSLFNNVTGIIKSQGAIGVLSFCGETKGIRTSSKM